MVKVGIVGGTGYTGAELLRLLAGHPNAKVTVITSRTEAGVPVADLYPNLRGVPRPMVWRKTLCPLFWPPVPKL